MQLEVVQEDVAVIQTNNKIWPNRSYHDNNIIGNIEMKHVNPMDDPFSALFYWYALKPINDYILLQNIHNFLCTKF